VIFCAAKRLTTIWAHCAPSAAEAKTLKFRSLMDLSCNPAAAGSYRSRSRIAGVITEEWCGRSLYCAACDSNKLQTSLTNTKAIDFSCPKCQQTYQVKSLRTRLGYRILDSAYGSMVSAIRSDAVPNLMVLRYTPQWSISDLLLVPRFFFTESIIEKRNPLGPNARRAGWVGCNILLGEVPESGRIHLVKNGSAEPASRVRQQYKKMAGLAEVKPELRGWTLDTLRVVERLGSRRFTLDDVYKSDSELKALHPKNDNVRPKIRQQLQVLRDLGKLRFLEPGRYEII
jgi:type II restriction enzyme